MYFNSSEPLQPAIIALIAILCVVVVGAVAVFLGYRYVMMRLQTQDYHIFGLFYLVPI